MGARSAQSLAPKSSGQPGDPRPTGAGRQVAFQGCAPPSFSCTVLTHVTIFHLCCDMRKVERQYKPFNFAPSFFHRHIPESEVCSNPVAKVSLQYFSFSVLLDSVYLFPGSHVFFFLSLLSSFPRTTGVFYFLECILRGKNSESSVSLIIFILPSHRIDSWAECRPLKTLMAVLSFYAFTCW